MGRSLPQSVYNEILSKINSANDRRTLEEIKAILLEYDSDDPKVKELKRVLSR